MVTTTKTRLIERAAPSRNPQSAAGAYVGLFDSPVGELMLTGQHGALTGLWIHKLLDTPPSGSDAEPDDGRLNEVRQQLSQYFDGKRREFDLPIQLTGTRFQLDVWSSLGAIPYGETASYGDIAREIGRPRAVRAVGAANGANPVSIIYPCHRVIGSNGTMTGYGWGIDRKEWLLNHERNATYSANRPQN